MATYNFKSLSPDAQKKYQDALLKYNTAGTVATNTPITDTTPKVNVAGMPNMMSGTGAGLMAGVTGNAGMTGTGVTLPTGLVGLNSVFKQPETPKVVSDPYAERMNAALDKYLNFDNSAPYDVTTDPLYAPLKQQYEQAGQSAFNNQIGSLSAMTGGRPSTAAVGTATGAQNKYAQDFSGVVLPQLIQTAYNKGQDKFNNLAKQFEALQGLSNTSYNRGRDTVSDTGMLADGTFTQSGTINKQNIESNNTAELVKKATTIAAANYDDIQGYINSLPAGDPLIPYLQAERRKKIIAQDVATKAAEKEAADVAAAAEKETYNRGKDDKKFELDKKYTEAQISNIYADNTRQNESSKPTNIAELGTPEQLNYFNNAFSYLLEKNGGDGYKAYQQLLRESKDYNASMGSKLYNELGSQLQAYGKSQGTATNVANNQNLTYTDYFSEASKKMKQTNYLDEPMYSDEEIGAYINGLPLSNADKDRLANDLGLPK